MTQRDNAYANNDFFRMGAAVAVGELYEVGRLGDKAEVADEVRRYLASFGLRSMADIDALGIKRPYVEDFEGTCARGVAAGALEWCPS